MSLGSEVLVWYSNINQLLLCKFPSLTLLHSAFYVWLWFSSFWSGHVFFFPLPPRRTCLDVFLFGSLLASTHWASRMWEHPGNSNSWNKHFSYVIFDCCFFIRIVLLIIWELKILMLLLLSSSQNSLVICSFILRPFPLHLLLLPGIFLDLIFQLTDSVFSICYSLLEKSSSKFFILPTMFFSSF